MIYLCIIAIPKVLQLGFRSNMHADANCRFTYGAKELRDGIPLHEFNIRNGSTLHVLGSLRGGGNSEVTIIKLAKIFTIYILNLLMCCAFRNQ